MIHIVQPALPAYRVSFFQELQRRLSSRNLSLRVYASARDFLDVDSVVSEGFEASIDAGMSVHLGGRAFWQSRLDLRLAAGDVLVINGNPRLLSNYPLWLKAKRLGVPVIWWGHGWSAGPRRHRSWIRRQIMRLADAVLLYTDAERDAYIADGFPPHRMFALNNGLDIKGIDRTVLQWDEDRLQDFRRVHGLSSLPHWCIFIGRLSQKANAGLMIEALPGIRGDVGLIILGDGRTGADLRVKASALGVSSRIVWAGASFEESSVAPWMLSAGAFVYPGTVGLSLIHAFGYGLPAVVHSERHHHMPEFAAFENTINGLAFERGSAISLSRTVNDLFADEARRAAMSERAAALVHRTYNVEDMALRFMELIENTARRISRVDG